MKLDWSQILGGALKLVPYVVAGVNAIHTEASTATKTQMAQDALSIATQAAAQVLSPDDDKIANIVSGAVNGAIVAAQQIHEATQPAAATK